MATLSQPASSDQSFFGVEGYKVVEVDGGWIVGSINRQGNVVQLLPHGEKIPYRTPDLANEAMHLLASFN